MQNLTHPSTHAAHAAGGHGPHGRLLPLLLPGEPSLLPLLAVLTLPLGLLHGEPSLLPVRGALLTELALRLPVLLPLPGEATLLPLRGALLTKLALRLPVLLPLPGEATLLPVRSALLPKLALLGLLPLPGIPALLPMRGTLLPELSLLGLLPRIAALLALPALLPLPGVAALLPLRRLLPWRRLLPRVPTLPNSSQTRHMSSIAPLDQSQHCLSRSGRANPVQSGSKGDWLGQQCGYVYICRDLEMQRHCPRSLPAGRRRERRGKMPGRRPVPAGSRRDRRLQPGGQFLGLGPHWQVMSSGEKRSQERNLRNCKQKPDLISKTCISEL